MSVATNLASAAASAIATDTGTNASTSTPFDDALALWYIDEYSAASGVPHIANSIASTSPSANLFGGPRNIFSATAYWIPAATTVTDGAGTAPDGSTSATRLLGGAFWYMHQTRADVVPAGTYTLAINAKRNTGSDQTFQLYYGNTGVPSATKTATSAWQRFTYTFTLGAGTRLDHMGIMGVGAGTADILVCDLELYSGSSDLGPQSYAGHLYVGASFVDPRPSYASGELDLSAGGYGLVQFTTPQSVTAFTVQAMVSKLGAGGGGGYSTLLSKAQSYSNFSAMTEENAAVPYSYLGGSNRVAEQFAGLWVASGKGYHVVSIVYDGATLFYWLDDYCMLQYSYAGGPFSLADLYVNIALSASFYGGNSFAGAMALWDRALDDDEVVSTVGLQQDRAAASSITATTADRVLITEGDSITAMAGSYAYLFGSHASPALYGVNLAVGGSTAASMYARSALVDAVFPSDMTGRTIILSVFIGANDITPMTANLSTYLAGLAAFLDGYRAQGVLVAVGTMLPNNVVGFNALRNTANTTIRTWVGVHCDAVFDFAADATMGPDAAYSDTTYYSDGIHPTAAGHAILEPIYRTAINSL